ncbi:MAG: PQQ-binding-like beta-propeller repeat protein [Planctomycetota bacterium]
MGVTFKPLSSAPGRTFLARGFRCGLMLGWVLWIPGVSAAQDPGVSAAQDPGVSASQKDDTWSQFHGVNNQGAQPDYLLPKTWRGEAAWTQNLGSVDVGSPVIHDGRVYLLSAADGSQAIQLECRQLATGDVLWTQAFPRQPSHLHQRNTAASGTPAVDESGIVFAYAEPDHTWLVAVDHTGKVAWKRDFGPWQSQHGFGTSPRLFDDQVAILLSMQAEQLKGDQQPGKSRMISVDRATGRDRWQTPLKATRTCYGVPAVLRRDGKTWLVNANTGNGVFAIDANDGRIVWELPVLQKRVCSSPLIVGDTALVSHGSGGRGELFAVKLPADPNDAPELKYKISKGGAYVPTSAILDNLAFVIADGGIASCLDVESGKTLWMERIGDRYGASPIIIGDEVLLLSLDGRATRLRASRKFEKIDQFEFPAGIGATPAVAEGWMVLRVGDQLRGVPCQSRQRLN